MSASLSATPSSRPRAMKPSRTSIRTGTGKSAGAARPPRATEISRAAGTAAPAAPAAESAIKTAASPAALRRLIGRRLGPYARRSLAAASSGPIRPELGLRGGPFIAQWRWPAAATRAFGAEISGPRSRASRGAIVAPNWRAQEYPRRQRFRLPLQFGVDALETRFAELVVERASEYAHHRQEQQGIPELQRPSDGLKH